MRRLLSIAATLLLLAGCEGEPTGPGVLATYRLVLVNELPLPYLVSEDVNARNEIISGRVILRADSSFVDEYVVRTTGRQANLDQPIRLIGGFSRDGSTITFTIPDEDGDPSNDVYTGTLVNENELRMVVRTTTWYYER